MKKMKTSLKKRQQRAGSKTSKKLMMDSTSRIRRSITQLPHCVGTTFYWLLPRSISHYVQALYSKNLLCWILSALCFSKPWQPSSHYWEFFASPSTTHSSCKSPLAYLTAIAVFCLSTFFCFPAISSSCLSLSLYELVIIQHYNHHWLA